MIFSRGHQDAQAQRQRDDTLIAAAEADIARRKAADQAGHVDGRHYTEWVPVLNELRAQKRDDESLALLGRILDAVEAAATIAQTPDQPPGNWIASGYYERIAVIYRKRKDYAAEIAVLTRHEQLVVGRESKLSTRLEKARALLAKSQSAN